MVINFWTEALIYHLHYKKGFEVIFVIFREYWVSPFVLWDFFEEPEEDLDERIQKSERPFDRILASVFNFFERTSKMVKSQASLRIPPFQIKDCGG